MEPSGNEYIRGTLKTIILKLLAEPESLKPNASSKKMYGYEITQAVKERTGGEIILSFGALYPVLHKLEQEGLLTTTTEEVDGRLRKYYSLTSRGAELAAQKIADFEKFINTMQDFLQMSAPMPMTH